MAKNRSVIRVYVEHAYIHEKTRLTFVRSGGIYHWTGDNTKTYSNPSWASVSRLNSLRDDDVLRRGIFRFSQFYVSATLERSTEAQHALP